MGIWNNPTDLGNIWRAAFPPSPLVPNLHPDLQTPSDHLLTQAQALAPAFHFLHGSLLRPVSLTSPRLPPAQHSAGQSQRFITASAASMHSNVILLRLLRRCVQTLLQQRSLLMALFFLAVVLLRSQTTPRPAALRYTTAQKGVFLFLWQYIHQSLTCCPIVQISYTLTILFLKLFCSYKLGF